MHVAWYSEKFDLSVGENEYIIKPVNMHKLLGLHIDNTLSWTTHVNHLCSKLYSSLYLFNKIPKSKMEEYRLLG